MFSALVALVAGAATVFGFAPFGLGALPAVTLAILFHLWSNARSARSAAGLGFAFGIGLFGAGASWVSIALHTFGGMPLALAALGTAGFCAYLALFPALAGWVTRALSRRSWAGAVWLAAPAWTLAEWARSLGFSGFPWLSIGHSQVPGSPLAGFAPIGGTFGTTLAAALVAAALASMSGVAERPSAGGMDSPAAPPSRRSRPPGRLARVGLGLLVVCALVGSGTLLRSVDWTRPEGEPIAVSLLQGNVAQELKFEPGFRERTLTLYRGLIERARGRLVVLPESALPMFAHEVPADFADFLEDNARARDGDLLAGVFIFSEANGGEYHNSVISVGRSGTQAYQKRHLVPFGETIPLKPVIGWLINQVLDIPLADQTPGPADQAPLRAAGQRLAVGICYEDAFGAELIRQLPEASLLVNVSNDAWYGRSIAAAQHHQIAQARALETERWMLRATQTGITALVDHRGREVDRLPWFTVGVLEGRVQGRTGATPYVTVGDKGAVGVVALALLAMSVPRRRARGAARGASLAAAAADRSARV